MKKLIIICLLALSLINIVKTPMVLAVEIAKGAEVFQVHCVACHARGGNIVRWWKNLKIGTLKKNKLDSIDAIAYLVKNGKSNMSAYQDRLTETEIKAVSAYVLKQAENDWH